MTFLPSAAVDTAVDSDKPIEEELSQSIILAERIRKSAAETSSFKFECSEISKQVDHLSHSLRSIVRLATTTSAVIYSPPIRRISSDVSRNLLRALSLVHKCCRRRNFFHRLVNLITAADFRKVFACLDASVADLNWLISVLSCDAEAGGREGGVVLSLPPIASNDPILSWVWSYAATVQMAPHLPDRVEAALELASLAQDNDRAKIIVVQEGGVPPLLRLMKESDSAEGQIAAGEALINVGDVEERVRVIVENSGVPVIVMVLSDSHMKVQARIAELVARMAELDVVAKEEFGRENVIRPLVSLLSFETFDDDVFNSRRLDVRHSFHSLLQMNKKETSLKPRLYSSNSMLSFRYSDGGSSKGGQSRKERENESPEVKRELKVSCARALWMLSRDSLSNSIRITETKGLLCLAKLIEIEDGELQFNCTMSLMEIALAAESNADLRRSAFKTNSPAAKAVVEQLLRLVNESGNPLLQIPAIKSIGSLSRTFPARETRVIGPLVEQLSSKDPEVGTEAAIALGKFVLPDNYLCKEHAKTILEFGAIIPLMRLLREGDKTQVHGLILLCYLAIHASNNEAIEQARVLTALEGVDRTVAAQHPLLRELINRAICHLDIFRGDIQPLRQS